MTNSSHGNIDLTNISPLSSSLPPNRFHKTATTTTSPKARLVGSNSSKRGKEKDEVEEGKRKRKTYMRKRRWWRSWEEAAVDSQRGQQVARYGGTRKKSYCWTADDYT
jgi:hypothetical protein